MLHHGLADALRQATLHLAFHDQRVHHHAAIVHGVVPLDCHAPRIAIDADEREVHRLGIVIVLRVIVNRGLEAGLHVRRQVRCVIGIVGHRGEAHRAVGSRDRKLSFPMFKIRGRALQHVRGDLFRLVDYAVGCLVDRNAADRQRARAPGAVAEGDRVRVSLHEGNVLQRQPEAIRGDLAERGVMPLAVRMAAGVDHHLAVGVHTHQRALEAAVEPAARGEIGAVSGA